MRTRRMPAIAALTPALVSTLALVACHPQHAAVEREHPSIEPASRAVSERAATAESVSRLAPLPEHPVMAALRARAALEDLAVAGQPSAVVSVPLGTTQPRPVVVVAHGNFDRPEWECHTWRWIVGDRAFVLCPRGRQRADGPRGEFQRFTYDNGASLAREIDAGLTALRAHYGAYVDTGAVVYAGFSLGAILGPDAIRRSATPTMAAVMTEGSHPQWTEANIRAFVAGGGRRVLFACGSGWCDQASRAVVHRFEAQGVAVRYTTAAGAGHDYGGRVAEHVAEQIDWLFGDDPRFARSLGLPVTTPESGG